MDLQKKKVKKGQLTIKSENRGIKTDDHSTRQISRVKRRDLPYKQIVIYRNQQKMIV